MVIIDLPKGEDEIVEAGELEAAFKKAPVKKGDALLIRTGWGNDDRYLTMGADYVDKGPRYRLSSADKLMDLLVKNERVIWLYDHPNMTGTDKKTGENLRGFTIRAGLIAICGIVNANAITKPRVKLVALPIKVMGGHMGPVQVIAIED